MNMRTKLLAAACALALCAPLQAQTEDSVESQKGPKKGEVTKLDGTKFFGIVEITDDYTIRISNDSGITKLPIAQLGDADFKKYGFQKDRGMDGRFWYERKEALEDSEKDKDSGKDSKSGGNSPIEIRLGQIEAFQPVIAAYENTLGHKKSDKSTASSDPGDKEKTDTSDTPFTPMFSQPGMGGPLSQPFTGLGSSALQPVTGAVPGAAGAIQSATGAAGVPSPP